jgi:hypothetical protein
MRCVRSGSGTGVRTTHYALRIEVQQKTTGRYTCGRLGWGMGFRRGKQFYRGTGVLTQR